MTYIAKIPDPKGIVSYTDEENETWSILYNRQLELLQQRACDEYLSGLHLLKLPADRIPQCEEINSLLAKHTNWELVPVSTELPLKEFFNLLANKKFPAATFIRRREELDYVNKPDIFHEIIGHCPLLLHRPFADFLQRYGQHAIQGTSELRRTLGRLFFYTVETGLVKTSNGLKIYGSGILSSQKEILYVLDSPIPSRKAFDISEIVQTKFGLEKLQTTYYVIESFATLYRLLDCHCCGKGST